MTTFDFDLTVRALRPRFEMNQLVLYLEIVRRALDGIGDRGEKNIRVAGAHMLDRGLDIFDPFIGVAPHQEHPALDAALTAHADGGLDLAGRHASIHGIENALRSTLRTDPDAKASQTCEEIEHFLVQAVGSGNALERNVQTPLMHLCGILTQPAMMNR